jgi:hypothetical protein
MANSSIALGNLHRLQGRLDSAREWFERAAGGEGQHYSDLGLARVALAEGNHEEAHAFLAVVTGESSVVGTLARTLSAEVTLRAGDAVRATEMARRSVDESTDSTGSTAFTSHAVLGKCLLALGGRDTEAIATLRSAVELIERQGEGLTAEQEGVAYLRERAEPFADLAAALALTGADASSVFDVVERAHARSLRRVLGGTEHISGSTLSGVQAGLEDSDLLLTFLIGEDRGVVVAVTSSSAQAYVLGGWGTLRPLIRDLRRRLIRPVVRNSVTDIEMQGFADVARTLSVLLIEPIKPLLVPGTRLLVVPDQDLALVPFGALPLRDDPTGLSYLARDVDVAVLPMAGALPVWDEPRLPLLLAGNPLPDDSGEFDALPKSQHELAQIFSLWNAGSGGSLLPAACTSPEVVTRLQRGRLTLEALRKARLASFNTIHFATHAVASSLDPRRCAVILSRGERLSLNDIASLELGPALVILSACRTGEGEIVPGEGVVGLTWAFLHAGARAVAASLWSVEDSATAELMLAFHRRLNDGDDPIRALAGAQRERMDVQPHPAFWSPFVLVLKPTGLGG